ncbi:MAG: TonB-dependent receptor [Candidatus Kapabacteria bacterium]|nr:TonB-dependent receptor [Candidatus Kapabacteria bacterium]
MKTITKIFLLLLYIIPLNISFAEEKLTGIVYGIDTEGNKTVLVNANLSWLGSKTGAITDKDGKFSINKIQGNSNLIVSYTGFKRDTINVDFKADFIEITLKEDLKTKEIEVTAKQPSLLISESGSVKTEIITERGLKKAACCNLSESFVTNPSVDVSYTDAITGAKQIQLLGLQGSYVQLLTEQMPDLRGLASSFGLTYVPGPWMESIQLSKGTSSVVNGYESITGQINVEYKKPAQSEKLYLNFYADHSARFEGNAYSAYRFNPDFSSILLLSSNLHQVNHDYNSDGFLDKPLIKYLNLSNRWDYTSGVWESKFGVGAMLEERKSGQVNYFTQNKPDFFGSLIKTQRYEAYAKNGFILDEEGETTIGTIVKFNYHNQNSTFGKNIYDGLQKTFYTNLLYQSELIHNLVKYVVGFSYTYDNYSEKLNSDILARNESVPGVFGEFNIIPIESMNIQAGFRADYHNLFGTFLTPRLHIKYDLDDNTVIRGSFGKGYHIANILAENIGLLSSSRSFIFLEQLKPEEAWNYGLNLSHTFELFDTEFNFNAEYYRTVFINQVIVDLDQDPQSVFFYNLKGKSYSNSYQFDLTFEPFSNFEVLTALRINDVMTTINNELTRKPMVSDYKALVNLAYSTPDDDWKFDLTAELNGKGRLPDTKKNPEEYQLDEYYPAFVLFHGQITKTIGLLEFYLGAENIFNYRQMNPIIAYDQPFSKYFDSSIIWGPVMGRMIYIGLRYAL